MILTYKDRIEAKLNVGYDSLHPECHLLKNEATTGRFMYFTAS